MEKRTLKTLSIFAVIVALFVAFGILIPKIIDVIDSNNNGGDVIDGSGSDIDMTSAVYIGGKAYKAKDGVNSLLLLGLDEFSTSEKVTTYNNSAQADFILLVVINDNEKNYSLLHLNRDTMTRFKTRGVDGQIVGSVVAQLALAHTYGTNEAMCCNNITDAVSTLVYSAKINNCISMTMDGVSVINDILGGVTVTVDTDMTEINEKLKPGAPVKLNGDEALKFIRARSDLSDSSNLARMERQKIYLKSLINQISSLDGSESFVIETYNRMSEYSYSNCTVNQFIDYYNKLLEYDFNGIFSPDGEAVKGDEFMEFYVDEESLRDIVISLYYDEIE